MSTSSPSKVQPIPAGMHSVTPHLICAGAEEAIAFYKKAFNATEEGLMKNDDGKVIHAQIRIGDSPIMLMDEMPEWGALGPNSLNGSPVSIHLYVEDVDSFYAQAVEAGATATMPLDDTFWGDRYGQIKDPFGHRWSVATHIKDLTSEEVMENFKSADCSGGCAE